MVLSISTRSFLRKLSVPRRANDMSSSDLRRRQTEAEKNVNRLRNCMPEKLTTYCRMHLSFLLELDGCKLETMFLEPVISTPTPSKKKSNTPFKKKEKPAVVTSPPLSRESVAQVYQLIQFLQRTENIKTEGLFRKTGNVARQRLLREWISQEAELHLDDGTFSPHDCATVLKNFISDLPDPLLTEKHFEAYCQIVDMAANCQTDRALQRAKEKQLKALQLMILLLPRENAILLECLLDLLHRVAAAPENKMTAGSLGVVFAPSMLCPKKLSAEQMQMVSSTLTRAVALMIEQAPNLFTIPMELAADVAHFWREMEDPNMVMYDTDNGEDKENIDDKANIQKAKYGSSSAVNTVMSFTERKSIEAIDSSQDTQVALAQLYAHIQTMPESAKKKKLLKQFNRASGIQPVKKGKHSRSRSIGDSLKKHFPILHKHKQDSCDITQCNTRLTWNITKPINIDESTCSEDVANMSAMKTPVNKYRPLSMNVSPAAIVIDLGASPCNMRKRLSDEMIGSEVKDAKIPNIPVTEKEITYMKVKTAPVKKLYVNTPEKIKPVAMVSPMTKSISRLPESAKKAVMTPRSRLPMLLLQSPNETYRESVL